MNVVGVECNADKYFFGRLLNDKSLIRKESNDVQVIKGIVERSNNKFRIGIVDIDKKKKVPDNFEQIYCDNFSQVFKHVTNYQFLILIGPRQFEHWINEYLKLNKKEIENFGFEDFNDFMENSKSLKPELENRFKNIINFVFENIHKTENHIIKLKRQLEYILESKYQFNIDEFHNI